MTQNNNDPMPKNVESERGITETKLPSISDECENTTRIKQWQTKEYLENEYVILKHTIKEIAKSNHVHPRRITQLFHKFGIKVRVPSEILNGNKPKDYTEKRFGRLVAKRRATVVSRESFWECQCDCGNMKTVRTRTLVAGDCESCGCITTEKGNKDRCGEMPALYFRNLKHNARVRNIHFDLQPSYVWDLFLQQNKKCLLSGVDIGFHDKTASLDRINSSVGYIIGNVRWVHKIINQMKWDLSDKDFMDWIILLYNKNGPLPFFFPPIVNCVGFTIPRGNNDGPQC